MVDSRHPHPSGIASIEAHQVGAAHRLAQGLRHQRHLIGGDRLANLPAQGRVGLYVGQELLQCGWTHRGCITAIKVGGLAGQAALSLALASWGAGSAGGATIWWLAECLAGAPQVAPCLLVPEAEAAGGRGGRVLHATPPWPPVPLSRPARSA